MLIKKRSEQRGASRLPASSEMYEAKASDDVRKHGVTQSPGLALKYKPQSSDGLIGLIRLNCCKMAMRLKIHREVGN